MEAMKRILVDIDATATAHPALDRAILLGKCSGAELTVASVVTVSPEGHHHLPGKVEERLLEDHRERLNRIVGEVTAVSAEARLLVGRPSTVLIQEVLRANHDLVLRSHARDIARSGPRSFGAVDMELLRKCPCPVLLVRHGQPTRKPRIACALDASSGDPDAHRLNGKIVELALVMANCLGAESPILLHAWTPFAEGSVRAHSTSDEFAGYVEDARRRAATALTGIAGTFGDRFGEREIALRRGEPEHVIPEFVVSEGIDVLVMGTVARSGLPGMLIGNTAERVLRKLPCSVLAVKPDGFVSPVRVD